MFDTFKAAPKVNLFKMTLVNFLDISWTFVADTCFYEKMEFKHLTILFLYYFLFYYLCTIYYDYYLYYYEKDKYRIVQFCGMSRALYTLLPGKHVQTNTISLSLGSIQPSCESSLSIVRYSLIEQRKLEQLRMNELTTVVCF